tara:strand:- start:9970 stop:10344 length:375 start_codon:yes stop_codon:yes gene_type:complete
MSDRSLGKVYGDGETIVQQGEIGDCMYVIQQGEVEVVQQEGDRQIQLRVLQQGDVFGEMAIFEREVRSASVRAVGSAQVLTIEKRTFLRRVKEDPTLAFNILQVMSQRIRKLNADVMRLQRAST